MAFISNTSTSSSSSNVSSMEKNVERIVVNNEKISIIINVERKIFTIGAYLLFQLIKFINNQLSLQSYHFYHIIQSKQ